MIQDIHRKAEYSPVIESMNVFQLYRCLAPILFQYLATLIAPHIMFFQIETELALFINACTDNLKNLYKTFKIISI